MPLFDTNELLGCVKRLTHIDEEWLPKKNLGENQLYVRFNHFSTDPTLGVKTPHSTKIIAILNPTSLKHKNLSVKCSDNVHKNWPLGHGQYTLSGNLGPLVPYVSEAKLNGFDDVLWLLDDFVQEMTILNVFFVI
jgi:branched-subunit amino acid aminotransferase/4-amino-4-deoxychorismate lyase